MAPLDLSAVHWQTELIFQCLFEDDEGPIRFRQQCHSDLEHDGPGDSDDGFDPVAIADKLRSVADKLNDDMIFKAALSDFKKAAAQEAVDTAFSHGVEALCTDPALSAEVTPEVRLISAALAFARYTINSSPALKNKVQGAMQSFLHRRADSWVLQQGGWDKVKIGH